MGAPPTPKVQRGTEVIAPFPESIEPARNVRSTILVASVDTLRALGHLAVYLAHLPKEHHPALLESVAAVWMPMDVALAHYSAIEGMGLPLSVQLEIGRRAMDRVGRTLVGTSTSMAKQAGVTPWTFLPRLQRFWLRGYDGGGVAVFKVGPKDARIDLVEFELCTVPFYRRALAGWGSAFTEMFSSKVYVQDHGSPYGPHSLSMRVQWV